MSVFDNIGNWENEYTPSTLEEALHDIRRKNLDACIEWVLKVCPHVRSTFARKRINLILPADNREWSVIRGKIFLPLIMYIVNCFRLKAKARNCDALVVASQYTHAMVKLLPNILSLMNMGFKYYIVCHCWEKLNDSSHVEICSRPRLYIRLDKFEQLRGMFLIWKKTKMRFVPKDVIRYIADLIIAYQCPKIL